MSKSNKSNTIILGIDIGNAFTKTSKGIKFQSKVSKDYGKSYLKNAHSVMLNDDENKKYLVGDPYGITFTTSNKYNTNEYMVTLLTAVMLSCLDVEDERLDVNIVLGCPVELYDIQKDICKNTAENLSPQLVTINNISKIINIENVLVAPQSAIVGDKPKEHFPILVMDFGGGTLDVSLWGLNNNSIPYKTYEKTLCNYGFDTIIDKFIKELYIKNISCTYEEALNYLNNPIINTVFGSIDYTDIKDSILTWYIKSIFNDLLKYNMPKLINTVYLIGGCTNLIKPYLVKEMNLLEDKVIVDNNPQFSNANSYYSIGKVVWS